MMHLFIRNTWQFATVGMLLGALTFTSDPNNEEDLLDPSLDRPLPQYESTRARGFEGLAETPAPKLVDKLPSKVKNESPFGSLEPARGSQLAPNPLQKLMRGDATADQPSPSDILNTKPDPAKTKKPPAKQPEYNSPFKPKKKADPKKASKKSTDKKSADKSSKTKSKQKKNTKKKKAPVLRQPELNYNIYRDQGVYPLDPRKPNNPCTGNCEGGTCGCGCSARNVPGLHGRPYQPHEPGGYSCGKNCPTKRPQFSVYWPRPFSAKLDERHPQQAAARYSGCQKKKLTDVFDRLVNFRLIDYQRTDNGYYGPGSDPYGCLGESKVAGVGFRVQSVPNVPTNTYPVGGSYPIW